MKAGIFFKALMIISFLTGSLMLSAQTDTNMNRNRNSDKNTGTGTDVIDNNTNDPSRNSTNSNQATDINPQDKTGTTTTERTDASKRNYQNSNLDSQDKEFVEEAASGGMMEVELGRLAQQKSTNPRVSAFGAMMVRDHTKANGELKAVAMRKNITIDSQMKDKHHQKVEKFSDKSGANFDEEYMEMMVNDHQDDLDLFRKESEKGKETDLKNFASKTIAVLQMHLDSARAIQSSLKMNR